MSKFYSTQSIEDIDENDEEKSNTAHFGKLSSIRSFFYRHSNNHQNNEEQNHDERLDQSLLRHDTYSSMMLDYPSSQLPIHSHSYITPKPTPSTSPTRTRTNNRYCYRYNNNNNNNPTNSSNTNTSSTSSCYSSSKLMKLLGKILAILTTLLFLITVPLLTIYAIKNNETTRPDFVAFYSAGLFVFITVGMSMKLIYHHLTHWFAPDVQKYVVRILWMIPLYAVQSWLSLRFHSVRMYIDACRDLYEAFVIQSFLYYLIEILGGEDSIVSMIQGKDEHYGHHEFGFQCIFSTWDMGIEFLLQCKRGVLQYVVVKIGATLLTCLFGELHWYHGDVLISAIINASQMWALYCLVKFYHAMSDNLRHPVNWHPLGKFLCVKGVVFFTWWQSQGIAIMVAMGMIHNVGTWTSEDVANALQDYLICVEMFCFAIAHSFSFTFVEYLPSHYLGRGGRNGLGGGGSTGVGDYNVLSDEYGDGDCGGDRAYQGISTGKRRQQHDPYNIYSQRNYYQDNDDDDDEDNHGGGDTTFRGDDEDDREDSYMPPIIRTLHAPMGFKDALWSSTLPNETFDEIKRFRNGVSDELMMNDELGVAMNLVSVQHAESI